MGLDIHGVLGEAVAEPRKKEQERATWALFRLTTVIPSSSFQEMLASWMASPWAAPMQICLLLLGISSLKN